MCSLFRHITKVPTFLGLHVLKAALGSHKCCANAPVVPHRRQCHGQCHQRCLRHISFVRLLRQLHCARDPIGRRRGWPWQRVFVAVWIGPCLTSRSGPRCIRRCSHGGGRCRAHVRSRSASMISSIRPLPTRIPGGAQAALECSASGAQAALDRRPSGAGTARDLHRIRTIVKAEARVRSVRLIREPALPRKPQRRPPPADDGCRDAALLKEAPRYACLHKGCASAGFLEPPFSRAC